MEKQRGQQRTDCWGVDFGTLGGTGDGISDVGIGLIFFS